MRSSMAGLACLAFVAWGCNAGDGPTTGKGGSSPGGTGGISLEGRGGAAPGGASGGAGGGGGSAGSGGAAPGGAGSGAAAPGGASGRAGAGGASAGTGGAGKGGASGSAGSGGAGKGGAGGAGSGGAGKGGAPGGAGAGGGSAGSGGGTGGAVRGLSWPIDCIPGQTCVGIGYPDVDNDGKAFDCSAPGYQGHEGTDISITAAAMDAGTAVRAAADGTVLFVFDGKYDRCPDATQPDCQAPPTSAPGPGISTGTTVCTPLGPYCGTGTGSCYWCFAGGNVVVIRHTGVDGVFATRYDHLRRSSILVHPGDTVRRGQKIAEAGSAGNSTGPHLHFEVWGTGFYELTEPWAGPCGPNLGPSLWAHDPPWN